MGGGGGQPATYVTPDLTYDYIKNRREREKKAKVITGMIKNKNKILVALRYLAPSQHVRGRIGKDYYPTPSYTARSANKN